MRNNVSGVDSLNEYGVFAEGFGRKFDEVKAVDSGDLSVSRRVIYGCPGHNCAGQHPPASAKVVVLALENLLRRQRVPKRRRYTKSPPSRES